MGCRCRPKLDRWEGGYVRHGVRRCVFVIEREARGRRFHVSTRRSSHRDALKELERFEADPWHYQPGYRVGVAPTEDEPMRLTADMLAGYRRWQLEVRRCTPKHAHEMRRRLADWTEDLAGRDLRRVTVRDLTEALNRRVTCRQHRVIAIKGLYKWLRRTGQLSHRDDPAEDLPVPPAVPAKLRRRKAVERGRVFAALAKLSGPPRDCLALLVATGWHVTELERFAREEESTIVRAPAGEVLAVLVTRHKMGEWTRTPIRHREHLEAAERLRARRSIPRRLNDTIRAACLAADVEPFGLGVLRHSVATWAIEDGATAAQVAEFLGHRDARTTKRFYADVSVPTVSVPVLRLVD